MKKQYQIDREEAVRKFQQQARHSEESLQLTLPLKQVAAALQEGVGRLMRDAGLELIAADHGQRGPAARRRALRASRAGTTFPLGTREWVSRRRRAKGSDRTSSVAR